jgi:glucan 1,3-beta-glucosidase
MSYRKEKIYLAHSLPGADYLAGANEQVLNDLFTTILQKGVHGFCFSLYEEGQKPGDIISEEQVRRRMKILLPHTRWIRSFSCTDGNEFIPKVAKEYGLKTLVGAWLGDDPEINRREVEGLIKLANEGLVDIAAVGNEVMYRKDLTEEALLEFIHEVKSRISGVPVGYVDAYYEFTERAKITAACDVVLCNCYPFWEGCPFENSLAYMQEMYRQAKQAGNGKPVIITETGWPSQGQSLQGAVPSMPHARDYFINTQLWSDDDDIPVFYFSSFDESWKTGPEGAVGAHWGIWDKSEKLKF